jgi:hypothetical protein
MRDNSIPWPVIIIMSGVLLIVPTVMIMNPQKEYVLPPVPIYSGTIECFSGSVSILRTDFKGQIYEDGGTFDVRDTVSGRRIETTGTCVAIYWKTGEMEIQK